MKTRLATAVAMAAMLAVGACASKDDSAMKKEGAEMKKMELTFMTAEELQKDFGTGSPVCKWTSADGKTSGSDFYYKTSGAMSGDLDRNIGDDTIQGSWKIAGSGFYIKTTTNKKALGTWMNLVKTGKKSYDAYNAAKEKVMSMKC